MPGSPRFLLAAYTWHSETFQGSPRGTHPGFAIPQLSLEQEPAAATEAPVAMLATRQ